MIFIIAISQMRKLMPAEGVGLQKVPELKVVLLRVQFRVISQSRLEVFIRTLDDHMSALVRK